MHTFGGTHLLELALVVVLVLDSRRLRAVVGSAARHRRDATGRADIPAGVNGDKVGLPLGQVQMRIHVDWEDGGIGWDGPEILPADDPPAGDPPAGDLPAGDLPAGDLPAGDPPSAGDLPAGEPIGDPPVGDLQPDDGVTCAVAEPSGLLPVLWKPYPAFLAVADWYAREESTLHPPGKEPGALVELRAHGESTATDQWPTVVPSARTA